MEQLFKTVVRHQRSLIAFMLMNADGYFQSAASAVVISLASLLPLSCTNQQLQLNVS